MCCFIWALFCEHVGMSCVSLCLYVLFDLSAVLWTHWDVLHQLVSVCAVSFEHWFVNTVGCLASTCVCMCCFIWALFCEHSGMSYVSLCLYVSFHLSTVLWTHWDVLFQLVSVCAISFERCSVNMVGCLVSGWVCMWPHLLFMFPSHLLGFQLTPHWHLFITCFLV